METFEDTIIIHPDVREAVAKAIYEHWRSVTMQGPPWEEVDEGWRTGTLGQAEAAITALFDAWAGVAKVQDVHNLYGNDIVLPAYTED